MNFWENKIPCWEIQGTLCEKLKENFCANCEVYLKYGHKEVV